MRNAEIQRAIMRAAKRANRKATDVEIGSKLYEDGTRSIDCELKGHGDYDLDDLIALDTMKRDDWPRDGLVDLYVYDYGNGRDDEGEGLLLNIYAEFKDGQLHRVYEHGGQWNEATDTFNQIDLVTFA